MTGELLAVAHRSGNSLARLHQAVELGADIIEADVHQHRGRLEVRHLKTMGPLPWLWDRWELRSAGAQRLGLIELLVAADRGVAFMLDLKGRHVGAGEAVTRVLHEYAPLRPVLVCSRYWPALGPFQGVPWIRTVCSARNRLELSMLLRRLEGSGIPDGGASVHRSLLTPTTTARLHQHVPLVLTWPVNDLATVKALAPLRCNGTLALISDVDVVLQAIVARSDRPQRDPLRPDASG